jgi:hypothetical protein
MSSNGTGWDSSSGSRSKEELRNTATGLSRRLSGTLSYRRLSPRQIGRGFSVSGRKLKGSHEELWITGLNCFVTDILHIGESAKMHYR